MLFLHRFSIVSPSFLPRFSIVFYRFFIVSSSFLHFFFVCVSSLYLFSIICQSFLYVCLKKRVTPLVQGRLRGNIGLFPSNYVATTSQAPAAGDALTDAEIARLQAQLKLLAESPA